MSRKGAPWENGRAESFIKTLKRVAPIVVEGLECLGVDLERRPLTQQAYLQHQSRLFPAGNHDAFDPHERARPDATPGAHNRERVEIQLDLAGDDAFDRR